MTTKDAVNTYRTTARVVGLLFLAGMAVYITGNIIVQSIVTVPDYLSIVSANTLLLTSGAMLMMLAAVWDAAHGILMFPVLKRHSERAAVGYLGYRIVDGVLLAVGILFLLLQIPLGREFLTAGASNAPYFQALGAVSIQASLYAYEIAMMFVGLAGLVLCYVFYQTGLVPRWIAVWGLIGYAAHLGGSALQIMGFDLALIHTIPGGLWELFIGVWLIVKGFNASAFVPKPAKPGHNLKDELLATKASL